MCEEFPVFSISEPTRFTRKGISSRPPDAYATINIYQQQEIEIAQVAHLSLLHGLSKKLITALDSRLARDNLSMDAQEAEREGVFAGAHFHVLQSKTFPREDVNEIVQSLTANGAEEVSQSSITDSEKILLNQITHIITTTIDFPDYEPAADSLKSVVKPDWVTASILKKKVANPRQYSPDPRRFYSGLVVCCADLPQGDSDAIIGGVLAMGGLYSSAVTKMVTHIVALTMDNEKCQVARAKGLKCKIVLPHWFDDCLKLGRRIDERPYCLPDPEILRLKSGERVPEVYRDDMEGATSACPEHLPTPTSSPSVKHERPLNVFKNKKVMLSSDLAIGSHLRGTIEDLVTNGGGSVTGSVHKADIFICQYRDSLDYRIASRAKKDVGNLSWLYYLITHNMWTSPMKRLLHYPVSREGLPGFKNFRISLSNYNGEARAYLENLAKAAGGDFTRTMKEDNTHLITAHTMSEKCEAAKEWNINMVNHLWLEESYAKWQIQTVSTSRYTHFPNRTNLGEVVGMTSINRETMERFFFPPGSDVETADEQAAKPMSVKDANAIPPKSVMNPPASSSSITPKPSKDYRRHTESSMTRTPATSRFAEGKENETPSTTGSRSAKEKANAKLHDLADDIALFQKESKRVGGVIHGGRRKDDADRVQSPSSRKRSVSHEDDTDSEVDEESARAKRAKKARGVGPLGPPAMRLALTGYKRWVGNARKEGEDRAKLRELGILVVPNATSCTHLASPHIVRTQKFICALAHAPVVLSTDFVHDCIEMNEFQDPGDYLLEDMVGEARIGHKLSDALVRAKANKGKLLKGMVVYATEAIHGGFDTYKAIVEVNGGTCLLYRARAGPHTATRVDPDDSDANHDDDTSKNMYLISGTTSAEAKLWPRFREMVEEMGKAPRIVRNDWMLNLALSQEIQWRDEYALSEENVEGGPV